MPAGARAGHPPALLVAKHPLGRADQQPCGGFLIRQLEFPPATQPAAELLHHESATRGADLSPDKVQRLAAEKALLAQRWGALVQVDPCYSPNLALDREDFSLAWPPRVTNS